MAIGRVDNSRRSDDDVQCDRCVTDVNLPLPKAASGKLKVSNNARCRSVSRAEEGRTRSYSPPPMDKTCTQTLLESFAPVHKKEITVECNRGFSCTGQKLYGSNHGAQTYTVPLINKHYSG